MVRHKHIRLARRQEPVVVHILQVGDTILECGEHGVREPELLDVAGGLVLVDPGAARVDDFLRDVDGLGELADDGA